MNGSGVRVGDAEVRCTEGGRAGIRVVEGRERGHVARGHNLKGGRDWACGSFRGSGGSIIWGWDGVNGSGGAGNEKRAFVSGSPLLLRAVAFVSMVSNGGEVIGVSRGEADGWA